MWPFKRTKSVPFCDHDWRLNDTRLVYTSVGSIVDVDDFYTVVCVKCHKKREMDRFDFAHLRRHFNVKMPEVTADESA
ncbi:hypothetical protein BSK66_07720 [Paenibacillus odorifer]|uniref:BED-type domain-containing protein n=1 Tax=Paenibacillus odorifer TaxID=189426 RepID=A0A1R0X2L7_9BACL|nr:hypothetical protein C171_07737 [Paenibacillus sp. FSL H8-237]OMD27447.1 hypothetical protein BJP51_24950 [Paenibacillus odorifer]OME61009.1 hypothetical protein BSK66_07720 [Paenibacillus odorifer]